MRGKRSSGRLVRDTKRIKQSKYSSGEIIRIVIDCLFWKTSMAELCRGEGIAQKTYSRWSKDFVESGKKTLWRYNARSKQLRINILKSKIMHNSYRLGRTIAENVLSTDFLLIKKKMIKNTCLM